MAWSVKGFRQNALGVSDSAQTYTRLVARQGAQPPEKTT